MPLITLIVLTVLIGFILVSYGIRIVLEGDIVIGIVGILLGIGIIVLSLLKGYHMYVTINNEVAKTYDLFVEAKIDDENIFLNDEAELYLNKVEQQGYLTNEMKIQLKHDLTDKNFDLRELKINGSSENDKSNTVYIKITYDGKSYFKSGKKLKVN